MSEPTVSAEKVVKPQPKETHVATEWKHESPLMACRFDPQGRYVFAAAEDSSVVRWELKSGAKTIFKAHDSWVRAIAFSGDGETLLTAGSDGRLIWWETAAKDPKPLRSIDAHAGWVWSLSVLPDGKQVLSGGNDKLVKLWNIESGELVRSHAGHESHVYSVLAHANGQLALSGDLQGQVRQWNLATGACTRTFDAKTLHTYNGGQGVHFGGVRSLSMSADGARLACGGLYKASNPLGSVHDPLVMLFDWESQKLLQSYIAEGLKAVVWKTAHHKDGFLIGACGGTSGGFLLFWKPDAAKEFHRFKLPDIVRGMDLHPDSLQIATAHYDKTIRISVMQPKKA